MSSELYGYNSLMKLVTENPFVTYSLFTFAVGATIISRSFFQWLPSVSPLLPAIFVIGKRGKKQGMFSGGSSYFFSNFFVAGGQGWWTIPQVLGASVVGACGNVFKKHERIGIVVGVTGYEIIVNTGWALVFGPASFITAIPFSLLHVGSSLGFIVAGRKVYDYLEAR